MRKNGNENEKKVERKKKLCLVCKKSLFLFPLFSIFDFSPFSAAVFHFPKNKTIIFQMLWASVLYSLFLLIFILFFIYFILFYFFLPVKVRCKDGDVSNHISSHMVIIWILHLFLLFHNLNLNFYCTLHVRDATGVILFWQRLSVCVSCSHRDLNIGREVKCTDM